MYELLKEGAINQGKGAKFEELSFKGTQQNTIAALFTSMVHFSNAIHG